ncbi:ABC transporter transmembrane domain-containing protein [Oscillibacter sp.]|uniref:ABC transporter transmembrane domain-containing protein n=1 Tax=Oscillibacter sp. TaxID=1945593 RepID=UPI00339036B4
MNGINVVHAYNAEDYQDAKFWKGNEELMRTQLFNQRAFAFLMPGVTLAMNALSLVIYWVGASIVNAVPAADTAARLAAFSDIVVFGTYATYVIMSIMMMVMIIMMLPAAQVSAQRINEVLETRNSLTQGARIDALETGTVEFRDVSFHYPSSDKNVLEHITFQAKRGETVAFIGATGSGKTTLVSLAARFYDATEGTVLVDGVDVRDYTFDALYDRIGYVTQKAILFSGDVRGNVLFGASRANSDADVQRLWSWPRPASLWTGCPEASMPPSPREAPTYPAARSSGSPSPGPGEAPGDPGVRRLFSALDYRTDTRLRAGLDRELKDTTRLIVAQRIGTIRNADKIIVLDEGRLVGMGTHEELMQTCPIYQEIARSQLSQEELGLKEETKMPKMMQNRMCAPGKSRRGIGGVLRELFTYSNKLKVPSVAAFCFAVAGAVLTIIGPSLLSRITDLISDALDGEIDLAAIGRTGVILLVIYGFSAVFTYVEHFIMATVTLELSRDMRQDLSRKINRVPMSYFSKVSYGDILSRITNDVSTLQQALANSLPSMISAVAQFLGCLVMMFVTEWRMALAAIAVTALGFLIMAAVMLRSQKYFTARQENLSTLNGYIEEMYSGHDVVRLSRPTSR